LKLIKLDREPPACVDNLRSALNREAKSILCTLKERKKEKKEKGKLCKQQKAPHIN